MTFTAALALLVAAVAPFVVAIITRPQWSADVKRYVAGGVCVVLGLVAAVGTGAIDGIPDSWQAWTVRIVVAAGIVVSLGQGFYQVFKPLVDKLEAATTPARRSIGDGLS